MGHFINFIVFDMFHIVGRLFYPIITARCPFPPIRDFKHISNDIGLL